MRFRDAFADELLKLAAYPQQAGGGAQYDASIAKAMEQYSGPSAKVGLKTGQPLSPAPAPAERAAPTPLTTPNKMVDYASASKQ